MFIFVVNVSANKVVN